MARQRVVEVEVSSEGSAVWWMLAGTAAGVAIGVIAAERMSGRALSGRSLLRKARRLVRFATGKWGPLLDAALEMRDAWAERRAAKARKNEPDDDFEDDDFEVEVEVDMDDDLDEHAPDAELDEVEESDDEEGEGEEEAGDHPIAARVFEAFINDPVLAERAVEIDADDRGNVFLRGRVRTEREVAHAVTIAGGVPGVTAVRQRLRVRVRQ